ncbi:MAG TPA: hypothetical protein VG844_10705 [Terracidiphilus sp.]|nr:hypothetical protein [Terracidiphilus sp.]
MNTEMWTVLRTWFSADKTLPKDVADAIQTLIDERDAEDDDMHDGSTCVDCGGKLDDPDDLRCNDCREDEEED